MRDRLVDSGSSGSLPTVLDETPYQPIRPVLTLGLQVGEGGLQPIVKLVPHPGEVARPVLGGIGEEVLGVVEEADVQGLELQSIEGALELVLEPLGMDAVPALVEILDHVGKRLAGLLSSLGEVQVLALDVADLADHHQLASVEGDRP